MSDRKIEAASTDSVEVLSGGLPTWRSLTAAEDASDELKAEAAAAEGSLRDELGLIASADNLVVLAGLGTSIGLRSGDGKKVAPKMSDLWAEVENLSSFKQVKGRLGPTPIEEKNLEHVLSDAQARASLAPTDGELATFISEAESLVWARCTFIDDGSVVTPHETFLRKIARRSTRLQRTQLFTTNYDLAFETAARRTRFNVIDGFGFGGNNFDGASFDLDFVRRRPNEQPALEPNVFHLLKLHGSVDWDGSGGQVRKALGTPAAPVLIYPSAAKYQLSFQQPYLEFMSRFQIALRQSDVGLIVVGFGFNDDHIVAPIQAALRSNIGLRAVVVTPGVRRPSRAETLNQIEDLIGLGDRRLTLVRGNFDDLVRLLPDVPQFEERDAHFDRVARRPAES